MFKKLGIFALTATALAACSCSTLKEPEVYSTLSEQQRDNAFWSEDLYDPLKTPVVTPVVTDVNNNGVVTTSKVMAATAPTDTVLFAYDSSTLNDAARSELKDMATFITANNSSINKVVVEGHADERGTTEYNLTLGDKRAVAARNYLVNLGVPASKVETISYGKTRPAVNGHTEAAWAQNRRAVVVLK